MSTRRPRIGMVDGEYVAIEVLNDNGDVVWYSDSIDGNYEWPPSRDFTPLAEVPEPRMDEPQETWATVVATLDGPSGKRVWFRDPTGDWVGCFKNGGTGATYRGWGDLIDPRPTTPTERATGIVGGEDQ